MKAVGLFAIAAAATLAAGFENAHAQESGIGLIITPRIQYLYEGMPVFRAIGGDILDHPEYIAFGGTIEFSPNMLNNSSVQLTVLHGATTAKTQIWRNAAVYSDEMDLSRTDIEVLLRSAIARSPASLVLGARVLRSSAEIDKEGATTTVNEFAINADAGYGIETQLYGIEIGADFGVPFGRSSAVFAQGLVGAFYGGTSCEDCNSTGESTIESDLGALSFDIAVGYQYAVSRGQALHIRYRANAMPNTRDGFFDDVGVDHGLEAGFAVRF